MVNMHFVFVRAASAAKHFYSALKDLLQKADSRYSILATVKAHKASPQSTPTKITSWGYAEKLKPNALAFI